MKTAADVEREVIAWGMEAMRTWTPTEVLCVLIDAHLTISDLRAQEAS